MIHSFFTFVSFSSLISLMKKIKNHILACPMYENQKIISLFLIIKISLDDKKPKPS